MSDQKQIQVTLEKLELTQEDVQHFYQMAEDMPHRYAKQVLGLLEDKIKTQLEAKVKALQAEYEEKLKETQLEHAEAKGELKALQAIHGE